MTSPPGTDGTLQGPTTPDIEQSDIKPDEDAKQPGKVKKFVSRWLPLCLFAGGFLVDFITLGDEVNLLVLLVIGLYAPVIIFGLWLKSLDLCARIHRFTHLGVHLCLGGLFSALVVLYFRSAGHFWALLIVLALFGGMIWNEFAHREKSQVELVWGIFCVSLVMYFNFLMPHLIGSISPLWFYASTLLALSIVWGLRVVSNQPWTTVRLAHIGASLIVICYIFGWIPPVPLVMENSLTGVEFERANGEYTAMVHQPDLVGRFRLKNPLLERHADEAVYILSAVSAPKNAKVKLEHRWFHEVDGEWIQTDTIPISIRGGRDEGWRFFSFKQNLSEGNWKVETALVDGAMLGYQRFHLRDINDGQQIRRERQSL